MCDPAEPIREPHFVPVRCHVKVIDQDIVIRVSVEGEELGADACGEVERAEGAVV